MSVGGVNFNSNTIPGYNSTTGSTSGMNMSQVGDSQLMQILNSQLGIYQQMASMPADQKAQLLQAAKSQNVQDPADLILNQDINQMRATSVYQQIAQQVKGLTPRQIEEMAVSPNASPDVKLALAGVAQDKQQSMNMFNIIIQQANDNANSDDPGFDQIEQDDEKQSQETNQTVANAGEGDDNS